MSILNRRSLFAAAAVSLPALFVRRAAAAGIPTVPGGLEAEVRRLMEARRDLDNHPSSAPDYGARGETPPEVVALVDRVDAAEDAILGLMDAAGIDAANLPTLGVQVARFMSDQSDQFEVRLIALDRIA